MDCHTLAAISPAFRVVQHVLTLCVDSQFCNSIDRRTLAARSSAKAISMSPSTALFSVSTFGRICVTSSIGFQFRHSRSARVSWVLLRIGSFQFCRGVHVHCTSWPGLEGRNPAAATPGLTQKVSHVTYEVSHLSNLAAGAAQQLPVCEAPLCRRATWSVPLSEATSCWCWIRTSPPGRRSSCQRMRCSDLSCRFVTPHDSPGWCLKPDSHLALGAAQQLPVHEALGRQEAAPEAQQAVKVGPYPLQHADQKAVARRLRQQEAQMKRS